MRWLLPLLALAGCDGVFGLEHLEPSTRPDGAGSDGHTGYAAAVLADEPVAYWRLGTASTTTAVDETGHGNTGTFGGGAASGEPGALVGDADPAVLFDGIDDRVTMGDRLSFEGTAMFTIEAWVKPTMHAAYLGVVSKADEDGGGFMRSGYHLYSQYMAAGFERNDGVTTQDVHTGALPLDTWSYLVVTYDGLTLSLYVDGTFQMSSEQVVSIPATSASFTIGARNGGIQSFFMGAIDEVAVYDRPLDPAAIDAHRRAALGD
jgi:hypothetical protein